MTTSAVDGLSEERRALLRYVLTARHAIADLRPTDMRARRLPAAMGQIDMIVATTETAANQIIGAVDDMIAAAMQPEADFRALVYDKCTAIVEACAFQDLTGQRIAKVLETLLVLENKLAGLAAVLGDCAEAPDEDGARDEDRVLLNGPTMPGEGVDQDDIDRMFA